MQLSSLLKELGAKKGLGKLTLDENGICRLIVNKDCLIAFEKSLIKDQFYLYSSVGVLSSEREKEVSLLALKGNLFGSETGQASLGYHPKTRSLILFESFLEKELAYAEFEKKFEKFLQYLAYWINKLNIPSAPGIEDLSLNKHVGNLQQHKNLKIFLA
jgi:hypothetical protein